VDGTASEGTDEDLMDETPRLAKLLAGSVNLCSKSTKHRNHDGPLGPAESILISDRARRVKGRCGTPLRSVSSLAFGVP